MRVPTVIRWPGKIPSKALSDEVISMIDVFPTLLAIAGAPQAEPGKIDGVNVLDAWRGKGKVAPRTLFWEWREGGDTQLAAMKGDMKLVITGNNQPELFNVVADPGERRTVDAEFPGETKEMTAGLEKWMSSETDAAKMRKKAATGKAVE
jgi:arylsulfatase A-like enzyme